jgi:hypothetical protein
MGIPRSQLHGSPKMAYKVGPERSYLFYTDSSAQGILRQQQMDHE